MASDVAISNMAISHLGVGKTIVSLTESSQEALLCNRFFTTARDFVLRDFPWAFARKVAALGLLSNNPTTEWRYSYQYPTDCLMMRRILSGIRNDSRQSRVPYLLALSTSGGNQVYTDQAEAYAEYTVKITDSERFPPDFVIALSYHLASLIAPGIAAGVDLGLVDKMNKLYLYYLSVAQANAANEQQYEENPDSEFIRVREVYDSFLDTERK